MPRPIDLRSDTVTRPSDGMRRAMASAEVGDDVFGEDPTVNRLEERVAELLGKESALFCPSGTMANLIGVACATSPGDEIWLDSEAHIVHYELAGSALVAGVQLRTFDGQVGGCPSRQQLDALRRVGDRDHEPVPTLLCLEQTHNRRGGSVAPLALLQASADQARTMGLQVHMDGARLANAAVSLEVPPRSLAAVADSLTFALSKGLGCPAGTMWLGSKDARRRAHIWRKRLGGGMRQIGILAAAGLYALDNNLGRLHQDHANAKRLAQELEGISGLRVALPVETNMVMLSTSAASSEFVEAAAREGVLLVTFGEHTVRCVTHLDVSEEDVVEAAGRLRRLMAA